MEAQLTDADGLPVRSRANDSYERVVNAIFGTIQQLAKLDRGDALAAEDKGQINYHVIMIGASRSRLLWTWLMGRKPAPVRGRFGQVERPIAGSLP